jgi:hypothetical protein
VEVLVKANASLEKGKSPNLKKLLPSLMNATKGGEIGANTNLNYEIYALSKANDQHYYELFLERSKKRSN